MPTIVIAPYNVATFPEGGGHFWVYLQYVLGLRQLGCEVYWLEAFRSKGRTEPEAGALAAFRARMRQHGLDAKTILYVTHSKEPSPDAPTEYLDMDCDQAEAVFARADLLLNFHYDISPGLLAQFRRTALVDIDPGLLQFWVSRKQVRVPRHDLYFTTGETVGTLGSKIPDCGLEWIHILPPVCLEGWPFTFDPACSAFTTVSAWDASDWIVDEVESFENTKRVAFLEFADLPRLTRQPLELALFLRWERDLEEKVDLERRGWRIRHSREVAATPEAYQAYIQQSRGEFSCAKRSCIKFQNGWVSDRTLCYLASGKPVVVQDTGPSEFLPNGEGMFRFRTAQQAAAAFDAINADYERHGRAARELAEAYFDAKLVVGEILSQALNRTEAAATSTRLESTGAPAGVPQWTSPVLRRHDAL
jgi:hypothetical protein